MSAQPFYIMIINFGSTSSKMGLYENDIEIFKLNIEHSRSEIEQCRTIAGQKQMRKDAVLKFLKKSNINLGALSAIAARAGFLPPLETGAYRVNQLMVDRLINNPVADHAANLCAIIAREIAEPLGIPVYIYDSSVIDQMEDVARISGLPDIERKSKAHMENMRAAAFETARKMKKAYEDLNLIVAHMGGGITMSIHKKGRMVDIISDDNGPFAPERAGRLPGVDLVKLCFSGKYDEGTVIKLIRGKGGMLSYLGTANALDVEERIKNNDKKAEMIYYAMAYQVAKGIGELATVVDGDVDRIILTGGLAHSKKFAGWIKKKVKFIAPVEIIPGEKELESLAFGTLRVLQGIEKAREYDIG